MTREPRSAARTSLFREHPALAFTLGYLTVSAIGLTFSWALFRRFDLNFFLFADVGDFLMSAFREPMTFVLAGSAAAVGWLVHRMNRIEGRWLGDPEDRGRLARGYAWVRDRLAYRYWPLAFAIGYCVLFIDSYASREAELIRTGETRRVAVLTSAGERLERVQTGAISRSLMFYGPVGERIEIFPQEAVARMLLPPRRVLAAGRAEPGS
jgi:hypothetical protein